MIPTLVNAMPKQPIAVLSAVVVGSKSATDRRMDPKMAKITVSKYAMRLRSAEAMMLE